MSISRKITCTYLFTHRIRIKSVEISREIVTKFPKFRSLILRRSEWNETASVQNVAKNICHLVILGATHFVFSSPRRPDRGLGSSQLPIRSYPE
jgi:hypothetical protein